ncbi:MAG: helix-turn-helix transcriptional regulator [Candidatus Coatesbacteria bacterium]
MEDVYARVAKRLRELRDRRGLTQGELAERAGISASFLSFLEIARRKGSLETYGRLADALGIPLSVLFQDVTGGPTSKHAQYVIPVGHLSVAERDTVRQMVRTLAQRRRTPRQA